MLFIRILKPRAYLVYFIESQLTQVTNNTYELVKMRIIEGDALIVTFRYKCTTFPAKRAYIRTKK